MDRTIPEDEEKIINSEDEPPHPADEAPSKRAPIMVRMSDVVREEIDWFWHARLAAGKLSLLIGDPKVGKSWVSLYVAATVSTGRAWFDGGIAPVMNTVLFT